jgi:DNA-binding CsgD family transcriptional regulator
MVEALEALRLLSSDAQAVPGLAVALAVLAEPPVQSPDLMAGGGPTWDEALSQSHLADILGPAYANAPETSPLPQSDHVVADSTDVAAGMAQMNRYLSRAWFRAGVPVQMHDDCSQAVYVSLLQNLGRERFDQLMGDVGQLGIREVLSRETSEGPDFFRAIDAVKKRAQRERTFQPLDTIDVAAASPGEDALSLWRGALQEAIDESLTPREASLVYETLMGKTPAEIASQWGVAPKTISNEKTRVIQKLRDALVADLTD